MIFRKIWQRFSCFPVVSQALQAGSLMGAGDLIAQTFIEKKSLYDCNFKRTRQYFLVGTLCVGPPLAVWYRTLHKLFGDGSKSAALKKVAVDQFLFAPFFMGAILGAICISQGHSLAETTEKLKRDYPDVIKNNYKVWPAVQLFNFYFVPVQFQVLTVQTVAVFWNTYISWKMSKC